MDDDSRRGRHRRKYNRRHLYSHRRLQACPFTSSSPFNPCNGASAPCADGSLLTEECEMAIVDYCSQEYELDRNACAEYLDLYTDCEYHVLPPEIDSAFVDVVLNGRNGLGTIICESTAIAGLRSSHLIRLVSFVGLQLISIPWPCDP